jgi:hypothetical protein
MTYTLHQLLALDRRILDALSNDDLPRFFVLFDARGPLIETIEAQHAAGRLGTPACRALLEKLDSQEAAVGAALAAKEREMEGRFASLLREKVAHRRYGAGQATPRVLNPRLAG